MDRGTAGRGRTIVAVAAVVLVAAAFLGWWQIGGGTGELPARSDNGFGAPVGGAGFLLFIVAIAALLLLTLPYASERPVPIDRPISFLLLLLVGLAAYAWRTVGLVQDDLLPIPPTLGPGFWLAGIGLLAFARGVFELYEARRPR